MEHKPFFFDKDSSYRPRHKLEEAVETGVAVIGGGFFGSLVTYHLSLHGVRVVQLERDELASGLAGRSGGIVTASLPLDFMELPRSFLAEAGRLWRQTVAGRDDIAAIVEKHDIDCDFERAGSLYRSRYGVLSTDLAEYFNEEAGSRAAHSIPYERTSLGILTAADCMLDPVAFVRGLARVSESFGARIYERTEAYGWDEDIVRTPAGMVTADRVIVCTETPLAGEAIVRNQAIVTEPLPAEHIHMDGHGMFWNTGEEYVTIRRITAGSEHRLFACSPIAVGADESQLASHRESLLHELRWYFPALRSVAISHAWTGDMVYPADMHPRFVQHNGALAVYGGSGNGLPFAAFAARTVASVVCGSALP